MTDIFDAKIVCKKCGIEMQSIVINRRGFNLRAVECSQCHDKIVHPGDLYSFEQFNQLKGKSYYVKLRVVGNSHAISIPKEIIDFIHESNKMQSRMNEIVKLCFEDFGRLSLNFGKFDNFHEINEVKKKGR